ncbi:hypothetical protein PILCRDRAFT_530686 [Piloderma croceum F 1598]|uniref:Uncharacterized protein n=1 Tax=Piloderma croceum (strain F 1598) TaxID=765440 RepID=A0A0C3F6P9_PILCF|nr:hypothetical protein PILCRDRAFT_530686 [Piloderma croceum F 1598]
MIIYFPKGHSPSTVHLHLHLVLHVLCGGRGLLGVHGRRREILGGCCDCGWGRSGVRERGKKWRIQLTSHLLILRSIIPIQFDQL